MASYDEYLQYLKIVDDQTLEELHRKEKDLAAQIAALQKSHREEIKQLESKFNAKALDLKSQYDQKGKELATQVVALQKSHRDEIQQLESAFNTKTLELKSQCKKSIEDNNIKCKSEIDVVKKQAETLVKSIKDEMEQKVADDQNVLQAMKDKATAQIEACKKSVSELKAKNQAAAKEIKALKDQNDQLLKDKSEIEQEKDLCSSKGKIWRISTILSLVMTCVAVIVALSLNNHSVPPTEDESELKPNLVIAPDGIKAYLPMAGTPAVLEINGEEYFRSDSLVNAVNFTKDSIINEANSIINTANDCIEQLQARDSSAVICVDSL